MESCAPLDNRLWLQVYYNFQFKGIYNDQDPWGRVLYSIYCAVQSNPSSHGALGHNERERERGEKDQSC